MTDQPFLTFPTGFIWGAATSAYQIEGAVNEDGRGPSIWDTFAHQPGKTHLDEHGDTASDHYHRWEADVRLMKEIGLQAYRFSIAWPRILPAGRGPVNQPGLDFYDRLVDALLEQGIQPFPTLFHWDLPQALQDQGGWPNRDIAYHFADYAQVLAARLGDRVRYWITHNEPFVMAMNGYAVGEHAPGIQDPLAAAHATHNLLLSHGLAAAALRAHSSQPNQVGITLNFSPVHPASQSEEDRLAAQRFDVFVNRLFIDPLLRGQYPEEVVSVFGPMFPPILAGDMETISTPLDFVGVNYYTRIVVRHHADIPYMLAAPVMPGDSEYSQMWEIYPPGIYELLVRLHKDYGHKNLIITENGIPVADAPDFDGKIRDYRRIRYFHDHLVQVHKAIQEGVPVSGYFAWSLLDNFEWALGYQMRYGLIYVDFSSQKRTIKESGRWYQQVAHKNGINLAQDLHD